METHNRISVRHRTRIDVQASDVISNRNGRIVDISSHGCRIEMDQPFAVGQRFSIELAGDVVFGVVSWAEIDRIGVRFVVPLTSGAVHDAYQAAIAHSKACAAPDSATPKFVPRPPKVVFGRKAA